MNQRVPSFSFKPGSGTVNADQPEPPKWILYPDLSGGLNTLSDAHAIARNQLAQSVNVWLVTNNAISKRPGNVPVITSTGATGSGAAGKALSTCIFAGLTNILVQSNGAIYQARTTDTAWTNIGSIGAGGIMQTTQLYDPVTSIDAAFITDGVDVPRCWGGPGSGALTTPTVPNNASGSAPITPKFCDTLFSSLFYAGEPTSTCAVYISSPFTPQTFSANSVTTSSNIGYAGSYLPYIIGANDGVNGGDITGIKRFGNVMLVFKQNAVYAMQQVGLFGDLVWAVTLVSASTGCVAPRSIVAFDTFVCFLGIDGVYMTDGATVTRISDNVPTFFDGTCGYVPDIVDRKTAVGARVGQRYCLWYDNGNGSTTPAGYPTIGMWFDFSKLDPTTTGAQYANGLPTAGQIAGMNVNGAASLRGPADNGTMVWCDGSQDRVGNWPGQNVFTDFGAPITVSVMGKADFFADIWGDRAPICMKQLDNVNLLISITNAVAGEVLTFSVLTLFDYSGALSSFANTLAVQGAGTGAVVGSAIVGAAVIGLGPSVDQYQTAPAFTQSPGQGKIIQVGFTETSGYSWTCLGYVLTCNIQNFASGGIGSPT